MLLVVDLPPLHSHPPPQPWNVLVLDRMRRWVYAVRYTASHPPPAALPPIVDSEKTPLGLWFSGSITNLAYLLHINAAAGRTRSQPHAYPIIPWVSDFSTSSSLRDLGTNKPTLCKGAHQMTMEYEQTGSHFKEQWSSLSWCMYFARVLPLEVLRAEVRPKIVKDQVRAREE